MVKKKDAPPPVECLLHPRGIDCECIAPVKTRDRLIYRLESSIRNSNISLRFTADEKLAARRDKYVDWLNKLRDESKKV